MATEELQQRLDALRALLAGTGTVIPSGGNNPVALIDPLRIWLVNAGWVAVFAVTLADGKPFGPRMFVCSVAKGEMMVGFPEDGFGRNLGLLAVGTVGSELLECSRAWLVAMAREADYGPAVCHLLDRWVSSLSAGVKKELPPKVSKALTPGLSLTLAVGDSARPKRGVVWVRQVEGITMVSQWGVLAAEVVAPPFPICESTWLTAVETATIECTRTREFLDLDREWNALNEFHRIVLDGIAIQRDIEELAEIERVQLRAETDRRLTRNVMKKLASVMELRGGASFGVSDSGNLLLSACRLIGHAQGIEIKPPLRPASERQECDLLDDIARASSARTRDVLLRGYWWRQDCGPLLAFLEHGHKPVALLQPAPEKYELHDPAAGTVTPVTEDIAASLEPVAHMFYRPLPDRPLTVVDLLKYSLYGIWRDLMLIMLMAAVVGMVNMVLPMATGLLMDTVIPSADMNQLFQMTIGLAIAMLASALFQLTRSFALLRVETRVDASLQAAIWDRLLKLPVPFFRQFSVGDLATRANGIATIRSLLSGTILSSILSSIFSVFSFLLLFYYSMDLALWAVGIAIVTTSVSFAVCYTQVHYQRQIMESEGRLTGKVLQFITGISKLRASAAEIRAFSVWGDEFSKQRAVTFKARSVANAFAVFNGAVPLLVSGTLFSAYAYMLMSAQEEGGAAAAAAAKISTGDFLAFNAAFGQFLAAFGGLSATLISILNIVPIYERSKPILEAEPEVHLSRADPGELSGEIDLSRLTFRYADDGPAIINDVSMTIKPGQFAAIVGPSGAGKSTLLRLLLGFEKPSTGSVYYDGQALSELDLREVRRQMGVVLQNGRLLSGDIFTNIVGATRMTLDDAWEAADRAGLRKDIEDMPMGMHTYIAEGGGTLSGGQRQRLLIARALVTKPRIIFFDEATSALDNITQKIVSESLEELDTTRVVIAHRLSTIINADQIFVMAEGKLVQQGTYVQLMKQPGVFHDLAQRQLVD